MRNKLILAVLTFAALAAAALPATADNVDVAVNNFGGNRTLFVEDMAGAALTELDFGTTRSQAFRVRVVDATMDRTGFTVYSEMTNLYLDQGGTLDFGQKINSANLSIAHPANPLNALDVSAVVQPVFDLVASLPSTLLSTEGTPICTLLGLVVTDSSCTISVSDLQGKLQTLDLDVDLNDLTNLPLLPQAAEVGSYTNPSFLGVGENDPAKTATAGSQLEMIQGTAVTNAAVLTELQTELNAQLASIGLADEVDTNALLLEMRDVVGITWDLLSAADKQGILNATTANAESLLAAHVLGQSGTYMSLPLLTVNIPTTAAKGDYKGTLVVTGLQP